MVERIEPLGPPYDAETEQQLQSLMPPGVPPLLLFRTFVRNRSLTTALRAWGGYELSDDLSLSVRDREIVIDRVCARCRCEYEWGVHVAFFGDRAGFSHAQIRSLTNGAATDACWTDDRDRLLIETVDALHDDSTVNDELYTRLRDVFDEAELLDLFMLAGWYHAISYCANSAGVELEEFAPRFADYA